MFHLTSKSPASTFLVGPTLVKWDHHPIRNLSIIFYSLLATPLHSKAFTVASAFNTELLSIPLSLASLPPSSPNCHLSSPSPWHL